MICSMTGYGRTESEEEGTRFTVEIRSVNNRFLDIQVKMPRTLAVLEPRVKKAVQERFSRGRIELFITRNGGKEGTSPRIVLDDTLAGQYIFVLRNLKERFSLSGEVDLPLVAGLQDVIAREEPREDPETVWPLLSTALSRAMDELHAMRTTEGAALVRDVTARLGTIEGLISSVRARAPRTVEAARARLAEAVSRLTNEQPDPLRLAQEIALLAERSDVTEELIRLASHLAQFRRMLDGTRGEAVGRKLDFLLQEMGREANTIASKAMDADIAYAVVDIKAELEKIREQVQNIE
jgi:uncharacterized protein (TIGR00255 family)